MFTINKFTLLKVKTEEYKQEVKQSGTVVYNRMPIAKFYDYGAEKYITWIVNKDEYIDKIIKMYNDINIHLTEKNALSQIIDDILFLSEYMKDLRTPSSFIKTDYMLIVQRNFNNCGNNNIVLGASYPEDTVTNNFISKIIAKIPVKSSKLVLNF